jgi:UDP-glucose 4-epimerase
MGSFKQTGSTLNDVYNIGGETLSLFEAANIVAEKFNVKVELTDWPQIDLKLESGDTIFDSDKLDVITGESYENKFEEWVKSLNS